MSASLYIRFGVHKDREILKETRSSFQGMVVPAHILSHTTDATCAAIDYIDKPYFIDPMTYIFNRDNIRSYITKDSDDKDKFKMSIEKMANDYGLLDHFVENSYKALEPSMFTDSFINTFCKRTLEFQKGKVDDQTESAYEKYSKILKDLNLVDMKSTDHTPIYFIPPYFYFKSLEDDWLTVNVKLYKKYLELLDSNSEKVAPIVLTQSKNLTSKLIEAYEDCKNIILWVSDLDESASHSEQQVKKLKKLSTFVGAAKQKQVSVINLYGSYFSGMLSKLGMAAFCNGIFYGEYKSFTTKVGGGAPPIRFYISAVHKFYLVPTVLQIVNQHPNLFDREPANTKRMLNNSASNIAEMLDKKKYTLAQRHFLWAREEELAKITESVSIDELVAQLTNAYAEYAETISEFHKEPPTHLNAWVEALS